MLGGDEPQTMTPWFKGFRGTIELLDHQRYVMNGEISEISDTKLEITELPVRTWTQTYKEQVGYCPEFFCKNEQNLFSPLSRIKIVEKLQTTNLSF